MTNPQDPSQPGQQPDPNQPGWAAPAPNAAPGWGQPPAQPGWGAPPPQQPPAGPGWGAPPPAGPAGPSWGAPPPAGYQQPAPGWGAPMPVKKKGHGCLIAFLIVLFIFLLGVGSCTVFLAVNIGPYVGTEMKLQTDLGSRGTVTFDQTNGHRTWIVTLKSAYTGQADLIACGVIRADLKGTQFEHDSILIEDSFGNVLSTGDSC